MDKKIIVRHRWSIHILMRYKSVLIGGTILLIYILLAIFGPLIVPQGPDEQNLFSALQPPSRRHPLGTDELGRDLLSRLIHGGRYSLLVTLISAVLASLIGVPMGLIAGYKGGVLGNLIIRIIDFALTFPTLVLAIIVATIFGMGLRGLVFAIVASFFPPIARLTYIVTLSICQKDFVLAAQALGAGNLRILMHHVFRNIAGPILVEISLRAGQAVLVATSLGFLGLGVSPPTPEWGTIMSRGMNFLFVAPHIVIATGMLISLSILGFNLLADGLRDMLDPRMRRLIWKLK
ncbi:MAG: ABC transporter permease [Candidatus Hadarchaeum sp.]|uniref:ABC transporter permease n=1 Tax=Candidatus Hadarchaeum sp. TaxID=2883567 RepID=UPI00317526C4